MLIWESGCRASRWHSFRCAKDQGAAALVLQVVSVGRVDEPALSNVATVSSAKHRGISSRLDTPVSLAQEPQSVTTDINGIFR